MRWVRRVRARGCAGERVRCARRAGGTGDPGSAVSLGRGRECSVWKNHEGGVASVDASRHERLSWVGACSGVCSGACAGASVET